MLLAERPPQAAWCLSGDYTHRLPGTPPEGKAKGRRPQKGSSVSSDLHRPTHALKSSRGLLPPAAATLRPARRRGHSSRRACSPPVEADQVRAHCSPLALRQAESALGPDGISQWASMGTFFPWHTAQKPLSKHGSIELDKLPLAPRRCGHRVLGDRSEASRAASAAKSASGSSSPLSTPVEYA